MDQVLTWPGRTYPAIAIFVIGTALFAAGLRAAVPAQRPKSWPEWALVYLVAFRQTVVGVCLAAAAAAWLGEVTWLLAASVCVGIGELIESSYYIGVLRWGQRSGSIPSLSR